MLNAETIIHPKLNHLGLTTGNMQPMVEWYKTVLGMRLVYRSENPMGAPGPGPFPRAAWLSNDEANHRLALVEIAGLSADAERSRHHRLQHFAFQYATLDELLGTYVRLKSLAILPVLPVDEGSQIAFYYADPDGNSVTMPSSRRCPLRLGNLPGSRLTGMIISLLASTKFHTALSTVIWTTES